MAGSSNIGEQNDNPVYINVTAMVDVIFCLCIFFICSFKFKQLEGKIETWLPKASSSMLASAADKIELEEIRISLHWDQRTASTIRSVGSRPPATSDADLIAVVVKMSADHVKLGKKDFPVLLEVARQVKGVREVYDDIRVLPES